jgi:hypothetical protein
VGLYLHAFFDLGLDGSERSDSHPGRFYPQGKSPRYALDSGPQSRSGLNIEIIIIIIIIIIVAYNMKNNNYKRNPADI